jgi:hypothetical protein
VAKLVARLLATAALWVRTSNPDISQQYKIGNIIKGVHGQHTLVRKKKFTGDHLFEAGSVVLQPGGGIPEHVSEEEGAVRGPEAGLHHPNLAWIENPPI